MNDQAQTQPTAAKYTILQHYSNSIFHRTNIVLLSQETNQRKHLDVNQISGKRAGPTAVTVAAGAARRL